MSLRYGNPESASFLLPGTGKREGGEKTQPFDHFQIRLVTEQGSNSSMFAISYSFILTELSPSLSFISFSPPPPDEGIGGNPRKGWNGVRATSSKIIWARFHVHGSGGNVAHPASDEFRVPVHERMSRGKREFGKRREETGGCHTVNGTEENCEEATEPKYLKSKIKPKCFGRKRTDMFWIALVSETQCSGEREGRDVCLFVVPSRSVHPVKAEGRRASRRRRRAQSQ